MRVIISLTLIALAFAQAGCPVYTCGNLLKSDVCLTKNGTNVAAQLCPSGQICDVDVTAETKVEDITSAVLAGNNKTCIAKPPPVERNDQAPGDFCRHNDNCTSKVCTSNKCVAKVALDGVCATSKDCDIGQWCNDELKCAKVTPTGQPCTNPGKTDQCGFHSSCW